MALILDIKIELDDSLTEVVDEETVTDLQCLACLSINRQLYLFTNNTELWEVFLKICNFYEEKPSQVYLCWECVSVLRKLVLFKNKVLSAESVLRSQLADEKPVKSLTSLCISRVINTDASVPIGEHGDVLVEEKQSEEIAQTDLKDEDDTPMDTTIDNDYGEIDDNIGNKLVEEKPSEEIAQTDIKDEEDIPSDTTIDDGMQFDDDYEEEDDAEDKDVTETNLKDIKEKNGKIKKAKKRKLTTPKRYKYINVGLKRTVKKVSLTNEEFSQWMEMERNSEIFKKLERKCHLCLCRMKNNMKLETHMNLEHQVSRRRPKQCSLCKLCFSALNLHSHMKNHVGRVCSECGYKCCTYYNMMRHIEIDHSVAVQCLDCDAKCSSPKEYYEHYKEYHTIFKCNDCEYETHHRDILVNHIGRNHSVARCDICNKVFCSNKSYANHKITHVIERTEDSFCVQCNIQFDNLVLFNRHLKYSTAHISERDAKFVPTTFQCTACPNVYKSKTSMNNHYSYVHTDTTRFYCEPCNRYFVNNTRLKSHTKRVHENYVPPKNKLCNICGRGFSTRRILKHHIRTHTGERPHECSLCGAKFAQKSALTIHMKHIHLNVKRKQNCEMFLI